MRIRVYFWGLASVFLKEDQACQSINKCFGFVAGDMSACDGMTRSREQRKNMEE